MFVEMLFEAIIHPNAYIITWNLLNRFNVYYIFTISLILLLSSIYFFIYFIKWGGIEKELKEEMKYCGVKTYAELKTYKREKGII